MHPPSPVLPRYATTRDPNYKTFGGKVAKLSAAMGRPFMPWQQQVCDTALEIDEEGLYRYGLVVLTVPRQSGKTALFAPLAAHRALTIPKGRIWVTAQLRQDARDTWAETTESIQESALGELTKARMANGGETLTFRNKSTFRLFNAGSDKALHGKQSDLVLIDEAFAFSSEQGAVILQAVTPTQATRPGAQTWIVSTAGTAASTWLRAFVTRGREMKGSRSAFFEWSIPEDTEDLTDLDLYAAHHPAIGYTIRRRALESAYETMESSSEFARAYGNFWTSSAEWAIAPALWQGARSEDSIDRRKPFALGAEINADRSGAAIVACGTGAESGKQLLEVIDVRGGIGWIGDRIIEIVERHPHCTVVVDPSSPSGPVHRQLSERRKARYRVPLADFGTDELVDGHTEFLDDLTAGHLTQPADERLDLALGATTTRTVRETTIFSRRVAEDGQAPAALIAAVLAHHGLRHPVPLERPRIHAAAG